VPLSFPCAVFYPLCPCHFLVQYFTPCAPVLSLCSILPPVPLSFPCALFYPRCLICVFFPSVVLSFLFATVRKHTSYFDSSYTVPSALSGQDEKVMLNLHKPRRALRAPGGWGSQEFWQSAHENGNTVSPTHRPPLPTGRYLVRISVIRGRVGHRATNAAGRITSKKNINDPIGNKNRNLPASQNA
jgi:hypothetical protein